MSETIVNTLETLRNDENENIVINRDEYIKVLQRLQELEYKLAESSEKSEKLKLNAEKVDKELDEKQTSKYKKRSEEELRNIAISRFETFKQERNKSYY